MKNRHENNKERGIALLLCILALFILSGIAASLLISSSTEGNINQNYRSEEIAFFAAKTGIYDALDRMQQGDTNSIACSIPTNFPGATQTTATGCASAPAGVLYLLNSGASLTVQPWSATNTYFDDEFCHEGFTIGTWPGTNISQDIPCTAAPAGSSWYATTTSNYPWSGTKAAIPYQWVRINWKQNTTQTYLTTATPPVTTPYKIRSDGASTSPVCYGTDKRQYLLTDVSSTFTSCEQYLSCGSITSPKIGTPVLMVTALAITPNGSRHMVQAEAALSAPSTGVKSCGSGDPYGFFAYGGTCSSPGLTIGGGASVDGYNSANGGTYSSTHQNSLGSVGTNGGAVEQGTSTNIGGNVYVPNPWPNQSDHSVTGAGSCPDDFSVSGNPPPATVVQSDILPVPTVGPFTDNSSTDVSSGTITQGTYRNLSIGSHGSVTLTAPGTYTFDCISMGSFGTLNTSPSSGKIVINITGTGCASSPMTMNSHSAINNASQISANFQINYGTGVTTPPSPTPTISMEGGPNLFVVLNAPTAAVTLNGGSHLYGTIMAYTIDDHGGTALHFDKADSTINQQTASTSTANATGSYNIVSFHSLPY